MLVVEVQLPAEPIDQVIGADREVVAVARSTKVYGKRLPVHGLEDVGAGEARALLIWFDGDVLSDPPQAASVARRRRASDSAHRSSSSTRPTVDGGDPARRSRVSARTQSRSYVCPIAWEGSGADPYEQNTQQSPASGRRID